MRKTFISKFFHRSTHTVSVTSRFSDNFFLASSRAWFICSLRSSFSADCFWMKRRLMWPPFGSARIPSGSYSHSDRACRIYTNVCYDADTRGPVSSSRWWPHGSSSVTACIRGALDFNGRENGRVNLMSQNYRNNIFLEVIEDRSWEEVRPSHVGKPNRSADSPSPLLPLADGPLCKVALHDEVADPVADLQCCESCCSMAFPRERRKT